MTVMRYLDIVTNHVTEDEMTAIAASFPDVDDDTPRVIVHEYGAWVNVQREAMYDEAGFAARYPNVAACLTRAHELDCDWINFDRDASHDDALPTYEW